MKKAEEKKSFRRRAAFTIIELLVVISIMAVIATLVTGAAIKSVRQSRRRRVQVMVRVLENGLVAYRTQENEWPFKISDLRAETLDRNDKYANELFKRVPRYWAHGEDNYKVFEEMLRKMATDRVMYFDPSALFVQRHKQMRDALLEGRFDLPVGYPDPVETGTFRYFCVEYNARSDSVKVHCTDSLNGRTHRPGTSMYGKPDSFKCPKWKGK
ncbi:MAG: prepilin-type N-terminal cleavage/methylation domain-containing protein [Kiritimatiellae bacterium]|nr:prepilin-type N-terminal cleavage/methylation domain-containing protein [Kiritimatiellia bacterium]